MKTVIISDMHIGANNCQAKLLVEFLEEISLDRLILNGDVFENFDSRLHKWHWKILSTIRKLSDKTEVIWIKGNHDAYGPAHLIAHLIGAEYLDQYVFTSGEKRVLCIHGDRFDNFISDHPILTMLAEWAYWALQKIDGSFYLAKLVKHKSKTFLRCVEIVEKEAIKLAELDNFQVIVCGHVHYPNKITSGNVEYLNCGSWTETPCSYVTIENGITDLKFYIDV